MSCATTFSATPVRTCAKQTADLIKATRDSPCVMDGDRREREGQKERYHDMCHVTHTEQVTYIEHVATFIETNQHESYASYKHNTDMTEAQQQ